uniref:CCAAT enhancer binding protein zeta n=1 Tax=Fundulus heteroclitus TaxID=8078 RepID=A0A3Q2QMW9_FUNHE
MLSALLTGVNRAYPYAGAGDQKVKEQLDTLFRVVHLARFNTAVQALLLLFQVLDSQQSVSDRFYVALYRKLLDPGLAASSRQNLFLNLLYKALKADVALRRVKAFIKRLLQVGAELGGGFACGALFLVSEVMKAKPGLRLLCGFGSDSARFCQDGEEEFKDLSEENQEEEEEEEEERFVDADKLGQGVCVAEPETRPAASWVHHQNLEGSCQNYDPLHRNPLFCGADRSTLWELHRLALHFHPSVSLFAKTILQGESIQYSGDPLQDFTLIRFLDRFVFRNPKQLKGKQNTDSAALRPKQRFPASSLPVNGAEFLSKEESQIPVEDVFFYRSVRSSKGKKAREDSEGSDVDDLDDEEVSLGSMDEEDFGDELEEEGGAFIHPDDDDDDDGRGDAETLLWVTFCSSGSDSSFFLFQFLSWRKRRRRKVGSDPVAVLRPAGLKQLRWEAQRDDWIHGRDSKTLRRKKFHCNHKSQRKTKLNRKVKKLLVKIKS